MAVFFCNIQHIYTWIHTHVCSEQFINVSVAPSNSSLPFSHLMAKFAVHLWYQITVGFCGGLRRLPICGGSVLFSILLCVYILTYIKKIYAKYILHRTTENMHRSCSLFIPLYNTIIQYKKYAYFERSRCVWFNKFH